MEIKANHRQEAVYDRNDIINLIVTDMQTRLGAKAYSAEHYQVNFDVPYFGNNLVGAVVVAVIEDPQPCDPRS